MSVLFFKTFFFLQREGVSTSARPLWSHFRKTEKRAFCVSAPISRKYVLVSYKVRPFSSVSQLKLDCDLLATH